MKQTNLHHAILKLFRRKIVHKLYSSFSEIIFNMILTKTRPNNAQLSDDDTLKMLLTAATTHLSNIPVTFLEGSLDFTS